MEEIFFTFIFFAVLISFALVTCVALSWCCYIICQGPDPEGPEVLPLTRLKRDKDEA